MTSLHRLFVPKIVLSVLVVAMSSVLVVVAADPPVNCVERCAHRAVWGRYGDLRGPGDLVCYQVGIRAGGSFMPNLQCRASGIDPLVRPAGVNTDFPGLACNKVHDEGAIISWNGCFHACSPPLKEEGYPDDQWMQALQGEEINVESLNTIGQYFCGFAGS